MNSGIYKITCTANGEFYIGSSKNLIQRKRAHWSNLRNNKHINKKLQYAFNKYGENNFSFEILEYCSPDKLIAIEQYCLDNLHPHYNLLKTAYEYKTSHRIKAETLFAEMLTLRRPKERSVCSINTETGEILQTFKSIKEAAGLLNLSENQIGNICRKKILRSKTGVYTSKTAKGMTFRYVEDYDPQKVLEDLKTTSHTYAHCKRRIHQLDPLSNNIIRTFNSIKEAEKELGLYNIGRACRVGGKAGGYYWKYSQIYENNKPNI